MQRPRLHLSIPDHTIVNCAKRPKIIAIGFELSGRVRWWDCTAAGKGYRYISHWDLAPLSSSNCLSIVFDFQSFRMITLRDFILYALLSGFQLALARDCQIEVCELLCIWYVQLTFHHSGSGMSTRRMMLSPSKVTAWLRTKLHKSKANWKPKIRWRVFCWWRTVSSAILQASDHAQY